MSSHILKPVRAVWRSLGSARSAIKGGIGGILVALIVLSVVAFIRIGLQSLGVDSSPFVFFLAVAGTLGALFGWLLNNS